MQLPSGLYRSQKATVRDLANGVEGKTPKYLYALGQQWRKKMQIQTAGGEIGQNFN